MHREEEKEEEDEMREEAGERFPESTSAGAQEGEGEEGKENEEKSADENAKEEGGLGHGPDPPYGPSSATQEARLSVKNVPFYDSAWFFVVMVTMFVILPSVLAGLRCRMDPDDVRACRYHWSTKGLVKYKGEGEYVEYDMKRTHEHHTYLHAFHKGEDPSPNATLSAMWKWAFREVLVSLSDVMIWVSTPVNHAVKVAISMGTALALLLRSAMAVLDEREFALHADIFRRFSVGANGTLDPEFHDFLKRLLLVKGTHLMEFVDDAFFVMTLGPWFFCVLYVANFYFKSREWDEKWDQICNLVAGLFSRLIEVMLMVVQVWFEMFKTALWCARCLYERKKTKERIRAFFRWLEPYLRGCIDDLSRLAYQNPQTYALVLLTTSCIIFVAWVFIWVALDLLAAFVMSTGSLIYVMAQPGWAFFICGALAWIFWPDD